MQKIVLTLIFFSAAFGLKAQDTTAVKGPKLPALYYLYENNYTLANRYNDVTAAKNALYSMINIYPQSDSLRFTLAYYYFEGQQYPSAILACMDVLQLNPKHVGALEMSAVSYENLGLKEKALTNYEQLYIATESIETLYKYTFVLYDLKRYTECMVNIDILLASEVIDTNKMTFQFSETEQKEFALRVAVLNLRGLVKKDQGDIDGARQDFNEVLKIAPDFKFAKDNLAALDK